MHRRHVLQAALLAAAFPWTARFVGAAAPPVPAPAIRGSLVLVDLRGGNDGLNTLVPYRDPEYYRLRPTLALARDRVLALDEDLGGAPALQPLMPAWDAGELAWILGVGYPNPNRSHFRSREIWDTAAPDDSIREPGWIARAFGSHGGGAAGRPDAVLFGDDDGPLRGGALQVLSLQTPEIFVREAARLSTSAPVAAPAEALAHLLTVRGAVTETAREFERALARLPAEPVAFPATPVGRQLRQVARLLLAGLEIPVFKVEVGGFDTHFGQGPQHARLWGQLAEALAAFRRTLRAAGQWDRVLVLSVSEFGRRVGENASQGTDHGAAAAQFALGGRVKGGFYGEQPSLHDLDRGDLRYRVDVRRLYGEIARVWWGQGDAGAARLGTTEPGLGFL